MHRGHRHARAWTLAPTWQLVNGVRENDIYMICNMRMTGFAWLAQTNKTCHAHVTYHVYVIFPHAVGQTNNRTCEYMHAHRLRRLHLGVLHNMSVVVC